MKIFQKTVFVSLIIAIYILFLCFVMQRHQRNKISLTKMQALFLKGTNIFDRDYFSSRSHNKCLPYKYLTAACLFSCHIGNVIGRTAHSIMLNTSIYSNTTLSLTVITKNVVEWERDSDDGSGLFTG